MPRNIGVYTAVAAIQTDNRLFDKSIATYLRGRKEIGSPSLFSGELAALYSLLLNYDEATREYLTILSMDERQLELIESRLAAFTSKKEGLAAATKIVERAVDNETHAIVYRRLLLWLTMEAKNFDRALQVAKEIDAEVNSNGVEMLAFAERAYNEKAYRVAAEAFHYSIGKYPGMIQIPTAKFGYARAIEEISAAADTADTSRSVSGLFRSETQLGYRGALGLFLALAQEYPNSEISANALYNAALIYYKQFSDLNGAERIIDSVIAIPAARPLTPLLLETAAEINVAKGTLDKAVERYTGIKESLKGSNVTIIDLRTDDTDRVRAKNNVKDTILKYPDVACLVGLWSYNGPAIYNAVKEAGLSGKIKVVCFDDEDETIAGVKDGTI